MSHLDRLRFELRLASDAWRQEAEYTAVLLEKLMLAGEVDQERVLLQMRAEDDAMRHYQHTRALYRRAAMEKISALTGVARTSARVN
jgi:hypothetical protein